MFLKISLKFLLIAVTSSLVFACSGKKESAPADKDDSYRDPRENVTMQRTKTDTLAVLYNVQKYLNFLKENQLDSAMQMLYETNDDSVVAMNDKRKAEIAEQLKVFPVLDYKTDMLQMFSEDDCEVRYTIEYFRKEPGDPRPNTLQCLIKPVRYGYYWYITIPEQAAQPPMDAE